MISAVAFNMLCNATLSFVVALMIVKFAIFAGRVVPGRFHLYLLSLPFLKVIHDTVRWIPADSFLWTGGDPFAVAHLRLLQIWLGLNDLGPYLGLGLRVITPNGDHLSVSFAEVVHAWLTRMAPFGLRDLPLLIVATTLTLSLGLVVRRVASWWSYARRWRRAKARRDARLLTTLKVGRRQVEVFLSRDPLDVVPYACGIRHPYVVFPEKLFDALSPEERRAALAHELAHIRYFDLPQAMLIQLLGDVFWFIPGYGRLRQHLEDQRELLADGAAIREGADPLALASTLLHAQEVQRLPNDLAAYSALAKSRSLLARRVHVLTDIEEGAGPRSMSIGWQALLGVLTTAAVLASGIGTNHELQSFDAFSQSISAQLARFFGWGWATF